MDKKEIQQQVRDKINLLELEINKLKLKLNCIENPNLVYDDAFFSCRLGKVAEWKKAIGRDIVNLFQVKSLVDLGCSIGSFLIGAKEQGAEVKGYEFAYESAKKYIEKPIRKNIEFGDLSEKLMFSQKYDCCLSVEVAEHLAEEFEDSFVDNLVRSTDKLIILTASQHNGKYHLNWKPREHWIEKIEKLSFFYRPDITKFCHDRWSTFRKTPGHMTKNLMIFTKNKEDYDNIH